MIIKPDERGYISVYQHNNDLISLGKLHWSSDNVITLHALEHPELIPDNFKDIVFRPDISLRPQHLIEIGKAIEDYVKTQFG